MISSVGGASGNWVISGVATVADGVRELVTSAVVDVPKIAEVDRVVIYAHRLGARASNNLAAAVSANELKKLVVSVLLVLRETSAPNVVIIGLFLQRVDTLRRRSLGGTPRADLVVYKSVESIARDTIEVGSDVAVSMEGVVSREVALGGRGNGCKDCESKRLHWLLNRL